MRRGDRLFEIIEILRQSKTPISAETIGQKLGVTKRTVYRDIAALVGQGVPIQGEAGVGHILEAGYHMPPLMLTPDEIEAAILGYSTRVTASIIRLAIVVAAISALHNLVERQVEQIVAAINVDHHLGTIRHH